MSLLSEFGIIPLELSIKKWVSYLYRTATTIYPCFLPDLGEFNRSWPYKTYPSAKVESFFNFQNF